MHLSTAKLKPQDVHQWPEGDVTAFEDFGNDGEIDRLANMKEEYQERMRRCKSPFQAARWMVRIIKLEERARQIDEFACI